MMQLVDALNKAVASGDRESMFRRADELGRFFNEIVLDVFKDFDAAWMRFKMAESMVSFLVSIGEVGQAVVLRNRIIAHYQHIRKLKGYTASQKHELKAILGQIRAVIPSVYRRERYGHTAPLIRLDKSIGISRWRITRQTTCKFRFAGVLLYEWSLRSSECLWYPSGCCTCSLGKVQSVDLYDCSFNKPLPLVGLSARISKMAG